ncbi:MAG: hypothetical protein LC115_10685 [Bacteroidia bacterium]|nr:hypothetical protein [Bacteroidia bacterium]
MKKNFGKEAVFEQIEDINLSVSTKKSSKNGGPTPAEIIALGTWLNQNRELIHKYMDIWMKGSLSMIENQQIRDKINVASVKYEQETGVDFYAPFKDVIQDSQELMMKVTESITKNGTSEDLEIFRNLKLEYKPTAPVNITIKPKFFLYYKTQSIYSGIDTDKPLRVAVRLLQNENSIPGFEFDGAKWNPITTTAVEIDNRATILISAMIEFPDGSQYFTNTIEAAGCGRCTHSERKEEDCMWPGKGCRCKKGHYADDIPYY